MLNFTGGPVMSSAEEFSDLMFENEKLFLELAGAPESSRAVF